MKAFFKSISSAVLAASLVLGGSSAIRAEGEESKSGDVKLEPVFLANVMIEMNNGPRDFRSEDLKNLACVSKKAADTMNIVRRFDFTHLGGITNSTIAEMKLREAFKFHPNIETIACSKKQFKLFVESESTMNFLRGVMDGRKGGAPINFEIRGVMRSKAMLYGNKKECNALLRIKNYKQKLKGFKVTCHEFIPIINVEFRMFPHGMTGGLRGIVRDIESRGDGEIIGCGYYCSVDPEGTPPSPEDVMAIVPRTKIFFDGNTRTNCAVPEEHRNAEHFALFPGIDDGILKIEPRDFAANYLYIFAKHVHDFTGNSSPVNK